MGRIRTYTIVGNTPAQKNSKKVAYSKATHRPIVYTEARVKVWQEDALWQLKTQAKEDWTYPVQVEMVFYFSDKRGRDIDNCLSTVLDSLRAADILGEDNHKFVSDIRVSFGGYDKANPRAEITITEI